MPTETAERVPPQSRDAERSVLGSMLRDNEVIDLMVPVVDADAFYFDAHQKIYRGITTLHQGGKPVDTVILAQHFHDTGELADVGSYVYLNELWDAAPTAANAEYYACIVREKGRTRALIHAATEILRDAYDEAQPVDELLAQAAQMIQNIAEAGVGETGEASQAQVMDEVAKRVDARSRQGGTVGVPTGFIDLDDLYLPGWQDSELVLLAGRPGTGKTALALSFMQTAGERGYPVLFVSLEQSRVELGERLLSRESRVNSQAIRTGRLSPDYVQKMIVAMNHLRQTRVWYADAVPQTVLKIGAIARRYRRQNKIRLLIIDYLQLISPSDRRVPRHEQVAEISRGLKLLARELTIPVLALTQLNRASEDRAGNEPRLSDLRESGAQEQDADTVLLLNRPDRGGTEDNTLDVYIAKQRNGPLGKVTLCYLKDHYRFENHAKGDML